MNPDGRKGSRAANPVSASLRSGAMLAGRKYADRGRRTVDGWFSGIDARTFLAFGSLQDDLGVRGDILEIGGYVGRSAILLGYLLRPGERLLVVDLFGEEAAVAEQRAEQERWYRNLTRSQFEANYRRFHADLPTILQGRSDEVLPTVPSDSCRFLHIDGAHEFEAVRADLREVLRIAGANSVIVFDDVLSSHTPGVTAAAWEAVLDGRIVPLVQSVKLYATTPGSSISVAGLSEKLRAVGIEVVESHRVLGHPILEVRTGEEASRPSRARRLVVEMAPPGVVDLGRRLRNRLC